MTRSRAAAAGMLPFSRKRAVAASSTSIGPGLLGKTGAVKTRARLAGKA